VYSKDGSELQQWYKRDWESFDAVKDNETDIEKLRKGLEDAVHRQLMSDVPYGVLLSGGLDSSVISAITAKFARQRIESGDTQEAWYPDCTVLQ
jgi:asparagine synthase (glutamine-hydrolysing)